MTVDLEAELVKMQLLLPRDHSGWARSVRWSCGRPGFAPYVPRLRSDDQLARDRRAFMAAEWARWTITNPGDGDLIKVTAT